MKIFTNNFALSFALKKTNHHFSFEQLSLQAAIERLQSEGPLFDFQVYFVSAKNDLAFLRQVFDFHTAASTPALKAECVLCFDTEAEKEAFIRAYIKMFKPILAAGGVVISRKQEMLLILRDGKWDLPKGKVEKGEAIDIAALREVEEETGVSNHSLGPKLDPSYHIYYHRKKWVLKTTYWYLMRVPEKMALVPQEKEGITQVIWEPMKQLAENTPDTYPLIMEIIREVSAKYQG